MVKFENHCIHIKGHLVKVLQLMASDSHTEEPYMGGLAVMTDGDTWFLTRDETRELGKRLLHLADTGSLAPRPALKDGLYILRKDDKDNPISAMLWDAKNAMAYQINWNSARTIGQIERDGWRICEYVGTKEDAKPRWEFTLGDKVFLGQYGKYDLYSRKNGGEVLAVVEGLNGGVWRYVHNDEDEAALDEAVRLLKEKSK